MTEKTESKKADKIDALVEKVESILTNWIDQFEKHPIGASIKALLIFWVVKSVYKGLKG